MRELPDDEPRHLGRREGEIRREPRRADKFVAPRPSTPSPPKTHLNHKGPLGPLVRDALAHISSRSAPARAPSPFAVVALSSRSPRRRACGRQQVPQPPRARARGGARLHCRPHTGGPAGAGASHAAASSRSPRRPMAATRRRGHGARCSPRISRARGPALAEHNSTSARAADAPRPSRPTPAPTPRRRRRVRARRCSSAPAAERPPRGAPKPRLRRATPPRSASTRARAAS